MVMRIAMMLALAFGMWSGAGVATPEAKAVEQCSYPSGQWQTCDEGMAFMQCSAALARARAWVSTSPSSRIHEACTAATFAGIPMFNCSVYSGGTYPCTGATSTAFAYDVGKTCDKRPSKVTPFFPPSGSVRCMDGCESVFRDNGDDTTTYSPNGKTCDKKPDCSAQGKNMVWNAMLGVCQPVEPECPEGKVKVGNACSDEKPCPDGMALVAGSCKKKDEECPSGMIRSPSGQCIPGDGQCAQGEVRGPDGTCKRDSNNDGEPDPTDKDDPESFSGGDSCSAPPSCSGSPIMCGQARIQWRIECNTRRNNNISGGHCSQSGMPTCTGEKCNAMEYSGLLMQWRSACALEKLAGKTDTPGGSNTDANGNGVADALEGSGDPAPIGDSSTEVQGAKKWGIGVSTGLLDTSNMFGGGSCPTPPTFKLMGQTISGADFPYFCQAAAILRVVIQIFAAFTAVQILLGRFF
ncbi:virulence factor TspB C-terminal domain-related protein [Stenotrophomonas lactitubi]|uniref:virulence factor TspB C-terminal domain-related protein n=1 Tax=Stenotrophomonas lactitubi TaxID=2045214 RepID=UPI0022499B8C|nr:virulence factor TspB C-terminal domain-related protein [Stenotrophomonas lactitubi]MCX2892952.1 virulence factor TspB C-terminal domain-related protein [Stenotrophomonas lactitubi]